MKKTSINAVSAVLQVVVTGLVYFLLYRFLLDKLGAELMGVWSLVLTTSSLANLANSGFTSGLVKFVAEYNVRNEFIKIPSLLVTGILIMATLMVILSVIIYVVSIFYLERFIPLSKLSSALQVLPFALIGLIVNALGTNFTSILEGLKMNYLKNIIYIIAILSLAIFSYFLVPIMGLIGVAYSQIVQSLIVFFLSGIVAFNKILRLDSDISFKKFIPTLTQFKMLFSYGTKYQGISICQMLYEPITKSYLSKFGGVDQVAYYEMANRLVSQVRSLITSANQVMIPIIAESNASQKNNLVKIYESTISIIISVGVPIFTTLILITPYISILWLGEYNYNFIVYTYMLSIVAFVVILNAPAYFGIVGEGKLTKLLFANIFMLMGIAILPLILTTILASGESMILLSVVVTCCGAIFMSISYQYSLGLSIRAPFSLIDTLYLVSGIVLSTLGIIIYIKGESIFNYIVYMCFLLFMFLVVSVIFLIKSNKLVKIKKSFLG